MSITLMCCDLIYWNIVRSFSDTINKIAIVYGYTMTLMDTAIYRKHPAVKHYTICWFCIVMTDIKGSVFAKCIKTSHIKICLTDVQQKFKKDSPALMAMKHQILYFRFKICLSSMHLQIKKNLAFITISYNVHC